MLDELKEAISYAFEDSSDREKALVIVESPYAAETEEGIQKNMEYLKMCMMHSTKLGEAPFASHMLYTQFLDDNIKEERDAGIECGFAWATQADRRVIYGDKGISKGMLKGIKHSMIHDIPIEFRFLEGDKNYYIEVHEDDIANVYNTMKSSSLVYDKGESCGTEKILNDLQRSGSI